MLEMWAIAAIAALGLIAGVLGGMLGVGGSLIMIPGLVLLFGQNVPGDPDGPGFNQHLYQAAAMLVNVAVAAPATWRHYRAGAVQPSVLVYLIPAAIAAIFLGVAVSNLPVFAADGGAGGPVLLGRVLAAFMVYVIVVNVRRLIEKPAPGPRIEPAADGRITGPRCATVGGALGFTAGLLGIGGGAVAVPLQQVILRLRLRNCIANSSAAICITAGFGALYKNATLGQHGFALGESLLLAALLAPTALVGGYLGASLTHILPVRIVRGFFIALMIAAAWRMAGLW